MANNVATIPNTPFDWKKYLYMGIGVFLFVIVQYSPMWADAVASISP